MRYRGRAAGKCLDVEDTKLVVRNRMQRTGAGGEWISMATSEGKSLKRKRRKAAGTCRASLRALLSLTGFFA